MLIDRTGKPLPDVAVANFKQLPLVVGEGAPQTAQRLNVHPLDLPRCQALGQGCVVELRVMARTRRRADVHEALDAVGLKQSDEALDWHG